ncbi:MAG TPA: rod shape-determining protein MreD [Verrucomicrobiae bacterium]|nr:rod shape-determining protein MreD [Verrucomicrobiae bacterium]
MSTLIAITGILVAGALQARLPTFWWLGGIRLEFLPALVAYATLTIPRHRAVLFALVAGLTQDALSAAPFGISVLAYGTVALLITGMRDALDRDLPLVQMGAGALASAAMALAATIAVGVSIGAVFKLVLVASLSGAITVLLFFAVDYVRMVWGHA